MICQYLQLSCEEQMLAETIALFHDIGRFTQFVKYRTFQDRVSVDHAALGAEILRDSKVLERLPEAERIIVLKAVEMHNWYRIPDALDERTRLHAKILRDADKLDIFRVVTEYYNQREFKFNPAMEEKMPDTEGYNHQIVQDILNNKNTSSCNVKNINDTRLFKLSWIFDINFDVTLQAIRKKGYIDMILSTLPDTPDVQKIRQHLIAYL
ncbi:metal-dependent phosphohydrolase [Peptoclostridium acidaminophilum DSM 3953]|uniref:Metal-dependent phosphohydrolase n=2 Tax=Peptoclostridium acidaminophilum TaxID=1731 RepID=W8THB9_PEPAC|nr:metal-dependent phosphohydrolase [Peptoclostridium acidaminophilum DSM 3953]